MKKSDLKSGMRARMRDGQIYLVVLDVLIEGKKDILFIGPGWMPGESYEDNLICKGFDCFDIVEVYSIDRNQEHFAYGFMDLDRRYSIWKRKEYTEEQKEIFKALKVLGFNWMARDKDNPVIAFDIKPERRSFTWYSAKCKQAELFTNSMQETFDFVKWEDEEPFEIPSL